VCGFWGYNSGAGGDCSPVWYHPKNEGNKLLRKKMVNVHQSTGHHIKNEWQLASTGISTANNVAKENFCKRQNCCILNTHTKSLLYALIASWKTGRKKGVIKYVFPVKRMFQRGIIIFGIYQPGYRQLLTVYHILWNWLYWGFQFTSAKACIETVISAFYV
jgi:hypothetical protein